MKPKKEHIKTGSVSALAALMMTYGGYFSFLKPNYSDYKLEVQTEIKEFVQSDEYNDSFHKRKFLEFVKSPAFKEIIDTYLVSDNVDNNVIPLRKLISIGSGVDEDKVDDIIAEMIKEHKTGKDHKWLVNLLRAVNSEFPNYNVWNID